MADQISKMEGQGLICEEKNIPKSRLPISNAANYFWGQSEICSFKSINIIMVDLA